MSKSAHHPPSRIDVDDVSGDKPVQRDTLDGSHLIDRILNTPSLERIVPGLQSDLLHRVILACGLEECSDLVALATPEQLEGIFDLDLWSAAHPGLDEEFDTARFGLWLEVLLEAGSSVAAKKLAGMEVDLIVAGLAQHVRVYDRAAITSYENLDGEQVEMGRSVDDELSMEIGGYVVGARRADSWEAIVEVLMALDTDHPEYFNVVMGGCRTLSESGAEIDGLHDLLPVADQIIFDLAAGRERRIEKKGYATPAQSRAFLRMARQLNLGSDSKPPENPLARAYFHAIDEKPEENPRGETGLLAAGSAAQPAMMETAESVAAVFDVLFEAGVITPPPLALSGGSDSRSPHLGLFQAYMHFALDIEQSAFSRRSEELAYLANTLMAGCSFQSRSFRAQEASEAVAAVCNLGLDNWPAHWLEGKATALPDSFLVDHDLVGVFQVGWAVIFNDVCLYVAEALIEVLTCLRIDNHELQKDLDALRVELAKCLQDGQPWHARDALDVIAALDTPAWGILLALIDECPVLHSGLSKSEDYRQLSVSDSDYVFISENSQIASIREFMNKLPESLQS